MDKINNPNYLNLLSTIASTYVNGKAKALKAVNTTLIKTYWQIGHHIVEFEQGGNTKAEYGTGLLENLSKDLSLSYGKGFSLSNIKRFRQFYLTYPIGAEATHQLTVDSQPNTKSAEATHLLSWSHYVELMKIERSVGKKLLMKR